MRLAVTLAFVFLFNSAFSQDIVGSWVGKLNVGRALTIVFNIKSEDSTLSATMDSPDQKASNIKADVSQKGDSIYIIVKSVGGRYLGRIKDAYNITGAWQQANMTFPLDIEKRAYIPAETVEKPQTPKPPYNYKSEDVYYYNSDSSIKYGATITLPDDNKQHPAMLLISGSGPQDRDGEIFGHKPFAVIADYLTQKGYIVLRADDRGVGENTGSRKNVTSEDYAKDALQGIRYLQSRPEVDKEKIGLIGHSEGGMIAEMIAADNKDIDFVILLAAPGAKTSEVLEEQNIAIMKFQGFRDDMRPAFSKLYQSLLKVGQTAKNSEELRTEITRNVRKWRADTDSALIVALTGIYDEESEKKYIDIFTQTLDNAWMKYFISYDPEPYLKKIDAKVLALNGSNDIQVLSKTNLEGIRSNLSKKNKVKTIQELEGLNHLFQKCEVCNVTEYAQLDETFSPVALEVMAGWLKAYVE